MNESILNTVKLMLGIPEDYEHFDQTIIMQINTVFSMLHQKGIGPKDGFFITGSGEGWSDIADSPGYRNSLKTYICQKVKMLFDPPSSASYVEAINASNAELEWLLYIGSKENFAQPEDE